MDDHAPDDDLGGEQPEHLAPRLDRLLLRGDLFLLRPDRHGGRRRQDSLLLSLQEIVELLLLDLPERRPGEDRAPEEGPVAVAARALEAPPQPLPLADRVRPRARDRAPERYRRR